MSDFGEGKWVVGRIAHRCVACYYFIPKGEEHYHFKGMWEGEWQDWRMHRECEAAHRADGCEEFLPGDYPVPERIVKHYAQKEVE